MAEETAAAVATVVDAAAIREADKTRRKARWERRIANGDCARCGRPRGSQGSARSCRKCLDKLAISKRTMLPPSVPVTPQCHREDGVKRVNHVVSLYPEDLAFLNSHQRESGASRSEIIRRALRLYKEAL